jgi:magnesium-transporting ATPase (P-type)
VGTAFAARTDRAALRSIGVLSNPMLLWGIAFELAFAATITYVPLFQEIFRTTSVPPDVLALMVPFPFVVWGADELRRRRQRRRLARRSV